MKTKTKKKTEKSKNKNRECQAIGNVVRFSSVLLSAFNGCIVAKPQVVRENFLHK